MLSILFILYLILGFLAVVSGVAVLFDLISERLMARRIVFFLRCILGSAVAALFFQAPIFQVHHLQTVQKIAMIATYGTGVIVLAWWKFHLRGAWGHVFALGIASVLYLDILGLSNQTLSGTYLESFLGTPIYGSLQASLFMPLLFLGVLAARGLSNVPKAWLNGGNATWGSRSRFVLPFIKR